MSKPEEKPRKKAVFDTELKAMARMVRLLGELPADAQGRVVSYMQSRYLAGIPKQAELPLLPPFAGPGS
jgi:hypothetical protein